MKNLLLMMMLVSFSIALNAQAKKKANNDTEHWRYEIECVGVGKPGTNLIKVWSYSKKPLVAIEQSKKNAVHALMFKGFAKGSRGCFEQDAIIKDMSVQDEKEDFFEEFFKSKDGKFMRFVQVTEEIGVTNNDVVKLKKEYKIGVVVLVDRDALRKYLEDEKIISGLNSIF
jgi:predicted homoserine dehydrogenase-like protein